jgi:hypothetical protein
MTRTRRIRLVAGRRRWPIVAGLIALWSLAVPACDDAPTTPPETTAPEDDFHDPLAMPAEPTLSPDSFNPSSSCGVCHERHYREWQGSMHAYSMVDPVFRALVAVRQADFDGEQDQFCLQCHSAIATRGGEIVPGFSFDDLSPIALEGIGCEACHKVAELVRPFNSGHRLEEDGPVRGPIADPVVADDIHASVASPLFKSSAFCGGCHDVVEVSGLELERPYGEWLESPAAVADTRCQDCHMPSYEGQAAAGAPTRTLHTHRFVGVDVPLTDGFVSAEELAQIRGEVTALLGGAARLELGAPEEIAAGQQLDVLVTVENLISGHNLPTGSTFIRELWVEVTATDANGEVLYQTGHLDANGDLRHHFSELDPYGDSDLLLFNGTLINRDGEPEIFPWKAAELVSTTIPPRYARTRTLFVPTASDTASPVTIRSRLRFRSHPPFLLRALGLDQLLDKIEIHDIASEEMSVRLLSP